MPSDFPSLLVLVFSSALTFLVARILSRKWRAKRRSREEAQREAQRRAGETRQVRRARERRAR